VTEIKLGIMPTFGPQYAPSPRSWIEIVANQLDLKLVEWYFPQIDPFVREPTLTALAVETRDVAKEYGVVIDTTFGQSAHSNLGDSNAGMRANALDWWEKAILLTAKLGARAAGGCMAIFSLEDAQDEARYQFLYGSVIDSVRYLTSLASAHGQKFFMWEPMPDYRCPPSIIDEAKDILEKANDGAKVPVKLAIDIGHAYSNNPKGKESDHDPYNWLRTLGAESPVVHLQQGTAKNEHWPFTEEYNKRGIMKADKVIKAIEDSGANETVLIIEVMHPPFLPKTQIIQDLKDTVKYWKDYV
jgi:sugar phosphate isomerase/epimerase